MGVLISAYDPLIADVVSSKIAGINPQNDYLLSRFYKKENSFSKIDLKDPNDVFMGVCDDFPRTNPKWDKFQWDLLLGLMDLYAKIVGNIKPPVLD